MSRPEGLFETILVRDGRALLLAEHLARLAASAGAFGFRLPDPAKLEARCAAAAARAKTAARMRVSLRPGRIEVNVESAAPYPARLYDEGAVAHIALDRGHPLGELVGHKILPYDALTSARAEARKSGAIDVIFVADDGALLEGAASNLFFVSGKVLRSPPLRRGILAGVTRGAVIGLSGGLGLRVAEEDLYPDELDQAEEAFLTGSLMEVLPLRQLGPKTLAPGPVARDLLQALRGLTP